MKKQSCQDRERVNEIKMQDVEEQRHAPEGQERRQHRRNALLAFLLIKLLVEPSQQQQRGPKRHQKKLQRRRILLDIKEENHSLFNGRLNVPRTLRDSAQPDRRISVQVGDTQHNKRNRQPKPDLRNKLSTAIFLQPINQAKNVARCHHPNPRDQRKQDKTPHVERQQHSSSDVQDCPQRGYRAELAR